MKVVDSSLLDGCSNEHPVPFGVTGLLSFVKPGLSFLDLDVHLIVKTIDDVPPDSASINFRRLLRGVIMSVILIILGSFSEGIVNAMLDFCWQ